MNNIDQTLRAICSEAIAQGVFSKCVIGVVGRDRKQTIIAYGDGVQENTLFDVASITKAIPTSSLALQLLDAKKISLEQRVIDIVPEIRFSDRENVLVRHLLTMTLDYNFRLSSFANGNAEDIWNAIFTTELCSHPGERFYYTNATSILLGLVVTRVYGKPLDLLASEHFFEPLGMQRSCFLPLEHGFSRDEIVATEIQEWRGGLVHGEVHDESAFVLGHMVNVPNRSATKTSKRQRINAFVSRNQIVGSAGLFSTAPDLLQFLLMMLHNGSLDGKRYFSSAIMRQIQTNQLTPMFFPQLSPSGQCAGLGFELAQPRYMGRLCGTQTFGKTGFTGCVVVCDIARKLAWTILSNATFPRRKKTPDAMNAFRARVSESVLA